MSETKLLEMTNITKAFASNVVLNGVNLSVDEGEVVAILGENGAGKSTLIKIRIPFSPATAAEVMFFTVPCIRISPESAL